jgi:hypothetical protein
LSLHEGENAEDGTQGDHTRRYREHGHLLVVDGSARVGPEDDRVEAAARRRQEKRKRLPAPSFRMNV